MALSVFHGGDIAKLAATFNLNPEKCVDLSTGVSPYSYDIQNLTTSSVNRMPYHSEAFLESGDNFYGRVGGVPIAGIQQAITMLPYWLPRGRVFLPNIGYREYQHHFALSGRDITTYDNFYLSEAIDASGQSTTEPCWYIVINPNNPTGKRYCPQELVKLHNKLQLNGGGLIIDESFIEFFNQASVLDQLTEFPNGLMVLRSFGKFFGMPGLRLGWLYCGSCFHKKVTATLGSWSVNALAQQVAIKAYRDNDWVTQNLNRLSGIRATVEDIFSRYLPYRTYAARADGGLFFSFNVTRAVAISIFNELGKRGIFVRVWPYSDNDSYIRVGLPTQKQLAILERVIGECLAIRFSYTKVLS